MAAVVEAADDVAALVRHACSAGPGVAVQPNGHGATGRTEGTILLRTGRPGTPQIDPVGRRARVGAGVPSERMQALAARPACPAAPRSSASPASPSAAD